MSKTLPQLDAASSIALNDELLGNVNGNARRVSASVLQAAITDTTAPVLLKDYHLPQDGSDWLPAFNRIQAAMKNSRGALIQCPAGDLRLSATLHIYNKLHIRGTAMGYQPQTAATRLIWQKNTTGIRCWDGSETNAIVGGLYPGPPGFSAAYACIEDVGVFCLDDSTATGHGVHASASIRMNRVNVQGFGGDGVHIFAYNATQGARNAGTGNANCWFISDSIIRSNKGNGLFVQGADANAGVAHMIMGGNNGLWDFVDQSYLGNTYIGCQSDGGGRGSFKGASTYIGCYNESKPTALEGGALIVGGVLGNTFQTPSLSIAGDGSGATAVVNEVDGNGKVLSILPVTRGSGYTRATVVPFKEGDGSGLAATANIVGGGITSYTIVNGGSGYVGRGRNPGMIKGGGPRGGTAATGAFVVQDFFPRSARYVESAMCQGPDQFFSGTVFNNSEIDSESAYLLRWNERYGVYETAVSGGPGRDDLVSIRWVSRFSTTQTMGRDNPIPRGSLQFPDGFWLGGGQTSFASTSGRYIGNGTAAPATGEWARGDIVYNTAPTSGGFAGWICTSGGAPGTWKTFGAISE